MYNRSNGDERAMICQLPLITDSFIAFVGSMWHSIWIHCKEEGPMSHMPYIRNVGHRDWIFLSAAGLYELRASTTYITNSIFRVFFDKNGWVTLC